MATTDPGPTTITELSAETWHLFEALVERHNGIFGGCWCIWFHPDGPERLYTVVGNICETDTFAWDRLLPEVREGDILTFHNAGAYGFEFAVIGLAASLLGTAVGFAVHYAFVLLLAGLAGMIGAYLGFTGKRVGPRPEDRSDAEIHEGAG